MGFDLYAEQPISKSDESNYFRNNSWWWRPLWAFCYKLDLISEEQYERGGYNDGYIINKDHALKIGIKLKHLISQGEVKKYADKYEKSLKALPDEPCEFCQQTGKREAKKGDIKTLQTCNVCRGRGKREAWAKSYPFSVDNVEEFSKFCIESGGFSIC